MKTVVVDPLPKEVADLIARRQALGLDLFDEVWEGTYHLTPAPRFRHAELDNRLARILGPYATSAGLVGSGPFKVGDNVDDFRVPDRGYHREEPDPEAVFLSTAAVIVEIISPGDESLEKLPFYARHGVDEILLADPAAQTIQFLALHEGTYREVDASAALGVSSRALRDQLGWT